MKPSPVGRKRLLRAGVDPGAQPIHLGPCTFDPEIILPSVKSPCPPGPSRSRSILEADRFLLLICRLRSPAPVGCWWTWPVSTSNGGPLRANARLVVDAEPPRDANVPVHLPRPGLPGPDQSTAGGGWDRQTRAKEIALCLRRERTELRGKDASRSAPGFPDRRRAEALPLAEPVITKSRYSGFAGTPLDALVRSRVSAPLDGGEIASTCASIESTLRDAYSTSTGR